MIYFNRGSVAQAQKYLQKLSEARDLKLFAVPGFERGVFYVPSRDMIKSVKYNQRVAKRYIDAMIDDGAYQAKVQDTARDVYRVDIEYCADFRKYKAHCDCKGNDVLHFLCVHIAVAYELFKLQLEELHAKERFEEQDKARNNNSSRVA